ASAQNDSAAEWQFLHWHLLVLQIPHLLSRNDIDCNTTLSKFVRSGSHRRLRKRSFSSPNGVTSVKALKEPVSRISFAALMKPANAARASAPPTEMRRTPRSTSCETVKLQLFVETRTLMGLGAMALTIAAI